MLSRGAEITMRTVLVGAALLGAVSAGAAAMPGEVSRPGTQRSAMTSGEGGNGAGSVRLASVVTSAFLFVPDIVQSPLVTVGEGGEGGKGGKGRRARRQNAEGGEGGEGGRGRSLGRLNADEQRLRRLDAEERRVRQLSAEERRLRQLDVEERRLRRLSAEERRLRELDAEERRLRRQRADRGLDEPRLYRRGPLFD
jgi:hypothetical protein